MDISVQDSGAAGARAGVAALVERAQSGDLVAFNLLVEQFQDVVFGAAYALLAHPHDAQGPRRRWCRRPLIR